MLRNVKVEKLNFENMALQKCNTQTQGTEKAAQWSTANEDLHG